MTRQLFLIATVLLVMSVAPAWATTIHVPADQPTIQVGIDVAAAGDTVLVAGGTYYEHDIVMKSGICLKSETGEAACVTIDAQGSGRVFYCDDVDGTSSVVGLTVTGGFAWCGAGMYCEGSALEVRRCSFLANISEECGGGLLCISSDIVLADCEFQENETSTHGGGMYCISSSPVLTGCTFSRNLAGIGGGMQCSSSSPLIIDCAFLDNMSSYGSGMGCNESYPTIESSTFAGNQTYHPFGAVVDCYSSSATFTACVLAFGHPGQAVHCQDQDSSASFACSDIYGNAGGDWVGFIADQYGVSGNISADPMFCDPDNSNFMLDVMSPCAPDNNSCGVLIGAYPVGCGASPVEATSWGKVKAMYR